MIVSRLRLMATIPNALDFFQTPSIHFVRHLANFLGGGGVGSGPMNSIHYFILFTVYVLKKDSKIKSRGREPKKKQKEEIAAKSSLKSFNNSFFSFYYYS